MPRYKIVTTHANYREGWETEPTTLEHALNMLHTIADLPFSTLVDMATVYQSGSNTDHIYTVVKVGE